MKVVSVVGARPQFIKAAVLSRELRKEHTEILIHTGQHYDENMSAVFFQELGIPSPEYELKIGSGLHGAQTGAMLTAIEHVLIKERPDWVVVYGDTNSTLAGALAASKLQVRIAHVEAGLRSFNRIMPEEINRVLTDHISDLLLCPTHNAVTNLKAEGISRGIHLVGDVMFEALMWAVEQSKNRPALFQKLGLQEKNYLLATVHRAENTDLPERLLGILEAFASLDEPLVWPVHPRTRKKLLEIGYTGAPHIKIIDPVSYLDMTLLTNGARMVLTDSGGLQKEAYWLSVPCITLRSETEWVETIEVGWNKLVGADKDNIIREVRSFYPPKAHPSLYSQGNAARFIMELIQKSNLL